MEKKRGNQVMAIAALFIAVIGLSLGFAAFSNTLTISSSATITPDASVLNVDFSNSTTFSTKPYTPVTEYTGTVEGQSAQINGVANVTTTGDPAPTYTHGTFNNSPAGAPTLTGLSAAFTQPGQSVTWTFYAYNIGELSAYLREIVFGNGTSSVLECTADQTGTNAPATSSLVTATCHDMRVTVDVQESSGSTSLLPEVGTNSGVHVVTLTDSANGTNSELALSSIAPGVAHKVIVTIHYDLDSTANSGAGNRPDGPVTVTIPDIKLIYKSLALSEEPTP